MPTNVYHSQSEKDEKDNSDHRGFELELLSDELLDAMQTGIIFADTDGIIRRINTPALEDLRITGNIVGKNVKDVLKVSNQDKNILPGLLDQLKEGSVNKVELPENTFIETYQKSAHLFVQGQLTRLSGKKSEIVFVFRNVVNEMIRDFMLKMALSSTKIFPWFYDMDRNVMVIDERYFAYTGIPTKDYTMTLEEFSGRLHPEDQPVMAHAFEQQLTGTHYPYPVSFRLLRGDGSWEWFEGQSTYLGQIDGVPYRVVGICMSTQAHKDIESALIAARNKAEQSDRLKSAFLANMSHEIRTPLNAIVGFSNLLTGGEVAVASEEAQTYVNLINTNCNQLLTLISDILDLSRIESETMEYSYSEFSLNSFLTEVYQVHTLTMPQDIDFGLLLPPKGICMVTDPIRLRQIMDNLLTNAEKFTSRGYIHLGYKISEDTKEVELFVEDTGRGIPSDQCDKIFERFYKVDSFVQGAGLGLSICKTIVEQMSGRILVSSRLEKGSRFSVWLPIKTSA